MSSSTNTVSNQPRVFRTPSYILDLESKKANSLQDVVYKRDTNADLTLSDNHELVQYFSPLNPEPDAYKYMMRFASLLSQCFHSKTIHLVLLVGDKGTGKSTLMRLIKKVFPSNIVKCYDYSHNDTSYEDLVKVFDYNQWDPETRLVFLSSNNIPKYPENIAPLYLGTSPKLSFWDLIRKKKPYYMNPRNTITPEIARDFESFTGTDEQMSTLANHMLTAVWDYYCYGHRYMQEVNSPVYGMYMVTRVNKYLTDKNYVLPKPIQTVTFSNGQTQNDPDGLVTDIRSLLIINSNWRKQMMNKYIEHVQQHKLEYMITFVCDFKYNCSIKLPIYVNNKRIRNDSFACSSKQYSCLESWICYELRRELYRINYNPGEERSLYESLLDIPNACKWVMIYHLCFLVDGWLNDCDVEDMQSMCTKWLEQTFQTKATLMVKHEWSVGCGTPITTTSNESSSLTSDQATEQANTSSMDHEEDDYKHIEIPESATGGNIDLDDNLEVLTTNTPDNNPVVQTTDTGTSKPQSFVCLDHKENYYYLTVDKYNFIFGKSNKNGNIANIDLWLNEFVSLVKNEVINNLKFTQNTQYYQLPWISLVYGWDVYAHDFNEEDPIAYIHTMYDFRDYNNPPQNMPFNFYKAAFMHKVKSVLKDSNTVFENAVAFQHLCDELGIDESKYSIHIET